jgi:outer membrane lipoprotein-sorting protein
MKRSVLAVGVLVGMGLAAAEAAALSVSYDQKTTQGRQVMQSKVSMKGNLFRIDTSMQGEESMIIRNAEGTFTVMPSEGMEMRLPQLRPGQGPVQGAEDYTTYLQDQNAQKTGTETVDGKACDVYRFTDPQTGAATTVWVWQEKQFPIKLDSQGIITEISNIQIGAAIPDSAFELPDGVQVMDMGAMMGMGMQ